MDPLLPLGADKEDESRGDTAARAVAPLGSVVVDGEPVPETVLVVLRAVPAGGRVAVVADITDGYQRCLRVYNPKIRKRRSKNV